MGEQGGLEPSSVEVPGDFAQGGDADRARGVCDEESVGERKVWGVCEGESVGERDVWGLAAPIVSTPRSAAQSSIVTGLGGGDIRAGQFRRPVAHGLSVITSFGGVVDSDFGGLVEGEGVVGDVVGASAPVVHGWGGVESWSSHRGEVSQSEGSGGGGPGQESAGEP